MEDWEGFHGFPVNTGLYKCTSCTEYVSRRREVGKNRNLHSPGGIICQPLALSRSNGEAFLAARR